MWFVSPENTPEENINEDELRQLLKDALRTLPEREALVIQLYYVEELNVYEIAEVLDVTTGRFPDKNQPSAHCAIFLASDKHSSQKSNILQCMMTGSKQIRL